VTPHRIATALALRSAAGLAALVLLTGGAVVSCSGDPIGDSTVPQNRPDSLSMGRWTPATDTARFPKECTQEVHDSHFVVSPDGKKYPTWHAVTHVDATSGEVCYFGHEHGDNPAGSALYIDLRRHFAWDASGNGVIEDSEWNNSSTGIPFGYPAEYGGAPASILHDSYKIALVNGIVRQRLVNGVAEDFGLTCNQLVAYAQDTQSNFAFNQDLHPLIHAIDCTGSGDSADLPTRLIVSVMADYGSTAAQPPVAGEAASARLIPDAATQVWPSAFVVAGATSDLIAALEERWDTVVSLRTSTGTELARFNPGLVSRTPARHRSATAGVQSIDLCYSGLDANGFLISDPAQAGSILRQVRGSASDCARLSPTGPATTVSQRIRFDARAAQFKGCSRQVIFRNQSIRNGVGPSIWYTTATGGDARTIAYAGSIKQYIATGISSTLVTLASVTDDASVDCDEATGVHVRASAQ